MALIENLIKYQSIIDNEHPIVTASSKIKVMSYLNLDAKGNVISLIKAPDKAGWIRDVPYQKKKDGTLPYLLFDTSSYFLGVNNSGKLQMKSWNAAKEMHLDFFGNMKGKMAKAIVSYFKNHNPEDEPILDDEDMEWLSKNPGEIGFYVDGKDVYSNSKISSKAKNWKGIKTEETFEDVSILSGKRGECALKHPAIKGRYFPGAPTTGVFLVSFNADSCCSGTEKLGHNAPMLMDEVRAYANALNYLLEDKSHNTLIGDTRVVFWAEEATNASADLFKDMFCLSSLGAKDTPDEENARLETILKDISHGIFPKDVSMNVPFHVVGLSANSARLVVEFEYDSTLADMLSPIARYHEISAISDTKYPPYTSPYRAVTNAHKLSAKQMRDLPSGAKRELEQLLLHTLGQSRFPQPLFNAALNRVSQERQVNQARASVMRAALIENYGFDKDTITMSLNPNNKDLGYTLGRLFRVIEALQKKAMPNANHIRQSYLKNAQTNPEGAYPTIINKCDHYIKLVGRENKGLSIYYEKLIQNLVQEIDNFPVRLSPKQKAEWILGYYQETEEIFSKKND